VQAWVVRTVAAGLVAAGLLAATPSGASALFTQCPPVGVDAGCQYLITLTDRTTSVQRDPTQGPYEQSEDSLIGVQNNSSKSIAALTVAGPNLFGFDGDGICNSRKGGVGVIPPGCLPAPGAAPGTVCGPEDGDCSFPRPPGQPADYTEPGAPPGNTQNGYEGPGTWFSSVGSDKSSGTVSFSPQLLPGDSTYFSLESPPTPQQFVIGAAVGGSAFSLVVGLPPRKKCFSRRRFRIRLRQPGHLRIRRATVFVNGKKVRVYKRRFFQKLRRTATVNLRRFPKGTYRVRIVVVTTKGIVLRGHRTYHTCVKKRKPEHAPKL
jgi:hypothetical protein